MEERKRHYRLGLFVVMSIAILATLLFLLGGRKLFQPTYTFETYFRGSVAGLQVGAPLQYRGVPLGDVTEIVTSGAEYERALPLEQRRNYIVVRAKVHLSAVQAIEIRRDAAEMVRLGLRTQTQLAGITGLQYLALDYLDPAKHPPLEFTWTPKYTYVPSTPGLTSEIMANAQVFMARLGEVDVKRLSDNLDRLVVQLNDKVGKLPLAQLSTDTQTTLKDARSALARVDRLLAEPGLKQSIDNLAAASGKLRTLADSGDLSRTVSHLDETVQRLNGLIDDNQYDARVMVQDLRVTADNLRALSATVKRYPAGALIAGPPERVQLPAEKSP